MNKIISLALSSLMLITPAASNACSRITYTGPENTVVTGRTMDWMEDIRSDLWAYPAGITRVGCPEPNSLIWTSKYGSVITSGYDLGTTDGINTEGLTANLLYLEKSDYGAPKSNQKNLSIYNWAQYFLDNYATVDEAVRDFGQEKPNMSVSALPNGIRPPVHLSITDKTGDNAIFEYVAGKLIIHHNKDYKVMTNEPTYDKQLVLNAYWQNLKGVFIPGTGEPEDRFVRASYYLNGAPQTADTQLSIAIVASIIRNVSVPMSEKSPSKPNVAPTIWRSIADLKNTVYYFENTGRPNIFWVNLKKLDLNPNTPVKKLALKNGEIYTGEVSSQFIANKPLPPIKLNNS